MKIHDAIARLDRVRPNVVPTDVKIGWISTVDSYIFNEIMAGREGAPITTFYPYTEDDMNKTLLAPSPYDELYIYKMEAELYYEEREITKYASSMALYNQVMREYSKKYMRDHRANQMPDIKYW